MAHYKKTAALIFLLGALTFGQEKFEVKTLSTNYNLKVETENCADSHCNGKTQFFLFWKNASKPFQIFKFDNTLLLLDKSRHVEIAKIKDKPKGKRSNIYLEDFNFDGNDDLALPDGANGGYASQSYKIYLYSPGKKKFVYNSDFTKLVQSPYMGIFVTNNKKKTLEVFWKSGCCMHYSETYKIIKNRPEKISEIGEFYDLHGNGKTQFETKKLIRGKWRTWIKSVPIKQSK
ncbi:MAG TPA: hypothetical protein VF571_01065 [Pyrinomonadaceae bacterium]|jgi:hypothetical protein